MATHKKINVILDIDETFVTYGHGEDWETVPPEQRDKYEIERTPNGGVFVLRPYLVPFFEFLRDNAKTVNLWTWSDEEYAHGVKEMLERKVKGLRITNVWYDDDADASKAMKGRCNKNLNYIWYTKKVFSPCDTVLIDDLPENTQNTANYQNGIRLPPFDVLGEKVKRKNGSKRIRSGYSRDLSGDEALMEVKLVLQRLGETVTCDDEERGPFEDVEHVGGGRRRRRTRRYRRKHRTFRKSK